MKCSNKKKNYSILVLMYCNYFSITVTLRFTWNKENFPITLGANGNTVKHKTCPFPFYWSKFKNDPADCLIMTGGIEGCHSDSLQCHQWWSSSQNDHFPVSQHATFNTHVHPSVINLVSSSVILRWVGMAAYNEPETKWLPFYRQHFKIGYLVWILLYFHKNLMRPIDTKSTLV